MVAFRDPLETTRALIGWIAREKYVDVVVRRLARLSPNSLPDRDDDVPTAVPHGQPMNDIAQYASASTTCQIRKLLTEFNPNIWAISGPPVTTWCAKTQ
jgi:hypothetical protein